MAEDADKESKTEEASQRRIDEAKRKGNTPVSREVLPLFSIVGIAISATLATYLVSGHLIDRLSMLLDRPGEIRLDVGEDAAMLLSELSISAGKISLPPMIILMIFGIAASLTQNPLHFALDRIKPQWSRLSVLKGAARVFGVSGRVEFAKAVVKLVIVSAVVYSFISRQKHELINVLLLNPRDLPSAIMQQIVRLFLFVAGCLLSLVIVDLVWSRFKWLSDLRMTKQEVKDEHKQAEGDPIVRARQRSLARDRARRRMIASVPRATVVIANPTHYAIALRYVRGEQTTPLVIAKGLDSLALRIREVAEQHEIPVIEDRALARSLYDAVTPDRPIPPEFYRAVAEIILYIMTRARGERPAAPAGVR